MIRLSGYVIHVVVTSQCFDGMSMPVSPLVLFWQTHAIFSAALLISHQVFFHMSVSQKVHKRGRGKLVVRESVSLLLLLILLLMNADDSYNITCENTAQNRSFLYISSWDNAELETCQEDNIGPSLVLPKQTYRSLMAYLTLIYMFTQMAFDADYRYWNLVNELCCGHSGEINICNFSCTRS